jgi:hypothetical protein
LHYRCIIDANVIDGANRDAVAALKEMVVVNSSAVVSRYRRILAHDEASTTVIEV